MLLNPHQGRPGGDNGRDRNQGRPGGDNGRGVKAVSGGGSEGDGGDDVEWVGEALEAVGVDEALRAVGRRGRTGFGHTLEASKSFLKT